MRLRAISFEYRITNSESPFTFRRSSKKKKKKRNVNSILRLPIHPSFENQLLQNTPKYYSFKYQKNGKNTRTITIFNVAWIISISSLGTKRNDECLSNCEKICPLLINNKRKVRMHFFSRICCTPFPRIWSSRWLREAEREERSPRKDAATGLDARLEQQIVNEPRREKAHPERRGSLPSSSRLSFPPRVLSLLALLQRPRPADGPTEEHRDKFGPTLSLLFFPSFRFFFSFFSLLLQNFVNTLYTLVTYTLLLEIYFALHTCHFPYLEMDASDPRRFFHFKVSFFSSGRNLSI